MTLREVKRVEVYCDFATEDEFCLGSAFIAHTTSFRIAREQAAKHGWTTLSTGGRILDICPEHSKKIADED